MKTQALTPFILFSFAVALPACQGGEPTSAGSTYGSLVSPPAPCASGIPTCNTAVDQPEQADLSVANSQNLVFSTTDNALTLNPGSGSLVDDDGDGVPNEADECPGPGWRVPCDGDPSNDGIYQTLYFNSNSDVTVRADVDVSGKIEKADAYILMDSTGSMRGEQLQLITDLTTGTFVDPTGCATAAGTGLVGALQCSIPDLWLGLGDFKEVAYLPHNNFYDMAPYHHYLDMTNNVQHVIDAVSALVTDSNKDYPEATTQALYSVVTGKGLGDLVPNRGSCPSTPAGRWGYPCFRPNVLPIILLFTDADMWNGPYPGSPRYGNPPYDGTVGLGTRLPPVEQSPNVLYSSDPSSAWDLGDLTAKSLTVMGTSTNLGDNAQTWDKGACNVCGGSGCWTDGRDAYLQFSVTGLTDMFISGQGTAYHTTNVALVDPAVGITDCDTGPGAGDRWGRFTKSLPAGDWYAVSDGAVAPDKSVADRRGNFQLRFHNLTADPGGYASWQTADLPITWTTVETELLASGVKIVSVISPNDAGYIAIPDATELGLATGSLDQSGNPYMQVIAGDGTGLSTALLDAVRSLVGDTRRDVSIVPEDNLSTGAVDETGFVTAVTATSCPTVGINTCLGGQGTSSCQGCLAETQVGFSFRLGNDIVSPLPGGPQIFEFDMVALADGTAELARIPVRVLVPQDGSSYGAGYYENSYDSDIVCKIPPEVPSERPDWGTLTWTGSTPSDSQVVFEFFTGDTLAELDSQIPASVTYTGDILVPTPPVQTYDIDIPAALLTENKQNYRIYLRVRARLEASTDKASTPIFQGWSTEFHCIEHE